MIEIKRASQLQNGREILGKIYSDAFQQDLAYFSKNKETLAKGFEHMFNLDCFYIALLNGTPAGMIACQSNQQSVRLNKNEFRKHFGFFKTFFTFKMIQKEFENTTKVLDKEASIEFIGVKNEFHRKGIASYMLRYVLKLPEYSSFLIMDVADTNLGAIKLYLKLGFVETARIKEKHPKITGINYRLNFRKDVNWF